MKRDFMLATIPFEIKLNEVGNEKNYKLYTEYIRSAVIKSSGTLGTTYKSYYNNMKLFFDYLYKYEDNPYIIDKEFLFRFTDIWERYTFYCIQIGNSKRTILNKRSACFSFFDWCFKKFYITFNPFHYIETIKFTEQDKIRKSYFLSTKEIWKIKYFLNEGEYNLKDGKKLKFTLQDNLIFNLFLDTGARISEIHSIRLDQIDLDEMMIYDVKLKEGYIENLFFFEETQKLIRKWFDYRNENGLGSDYLLVSKYKGKINQLSKETIRASIRKIGKIVDIKDLYPHSIRKTIINLTAKTDEQLASNLAHHSSLEVTRRYYVKKQSTYELKNKMAEARSRAGI